MPSALLLALLAAVPAAAHTALINTTPQDGKQVGRVPRSIVLTFGGKVLAADDAVRVVGPDGPVEAGPARVEGSRVSLPLTAPAVNGVYRVTWRVRASDGDPVTGRFSFTVKGAAPTPTPTPTLSPSATPSLHTSITGMDPNMPGMDHSTPSAPAAPAAGPSLPTSVALAGLGLLVVLVGGAMIIERARRRPSGAGPRGPSSG